MINCRKVGVPARPDIYHQCHFQALASAPLGTKEKQSSFDDTDSHIHNYLQSPNVNPVQRALNVWSKLQDVSNAAMIIDEYPLTYLNHCSLLGHQWMLYALINNGAWNSFYDGSCLIYLLLLIEHILAWSKLILNDYPVYGLAVYGLARGGGSFPYRTKNRQPQTKGAEEGSAKSKAHW